MRQRPAVFFAFAVAALVVSHRLRNIVRHGVTAALMCSILLAGMSIETFAASCTPSGSPSGEGQIVTPGQTVSGSINSGEDRISYLVYLCVGQGVIVEARATGGNLIPLIAAYDPDGEFRAVWTASRDDTGVWVAAGGATAQVEGYYRFQIQGNNDGPIQTTGTYEASFEDISQPSENGAPEVTLTYSPQNPVVGDDISLQAQASDPDGDPLAYVWLLGGQQQQADASNVVFTPAQAGTYQVTVQVSDGKGGTDEDSVSITVTATARSLIMEVLGAEQHEPLHDVPVKIVRISDGGVVAQGQTNSRGRTSPMNVPTSSSSSGLADLRAVVGFSGSEDPTFAYEQRWSDIPPELLQPSDEPRLFVVFLDFAGPSPEDAALVVPRRAGEAPCFDVEALGEVTITRIEHRGNLPRDKVMLFDQHYWGTSDTISLGYSAGARLQVPEDTSVTLHIANWAIIDLEPNTVFEIPCKTDPLGPPESWLEGVAEFLIQNAGNGYEVQTRTAISGVRGTHFRVDASSPANTRVEVFEGTVEVTPTNPSLDSATVQAGQQMSVTEDEVSPVTPIGGTPPPPPGPPGPPSGNQTIAQALDANGNAILDDVEIRQAIQFWILGQTVPGTDQTIDDVMIRQLIQMWILGEPVSSASAARTQGLDRTNSLDVQALQLGAPSLLERTLRVQGLNGERWRSGVQKLLVLH